MLIFVLSVLLALGVSFLCSLMEATLLSLTPAQVAEIGEKHPAQGRVWQQFKAAIEHPIAVILFLNTAAHTIGASVAGATFDELYGNEWIWLFALLFTLAMLQFTEIMPKTLGVRFNREIAAWSARPLQILVFLLHPLLYVIHSINRAFGLKQTATRTATIKEIAALARLAQVSQEISHQQEKIIKATTRLSQLRVGDVLIPVEEVSFLSTSQSLQDALIAAHMDAHTRFPVCEQEDRDRVVGYVNFKELVYVMRTNPHNASLRGITRPLHSTSPDGSVADLLKTFVEQHVHIALVRDDAGKTLGIVTLEDLLEELVGDLQDEFDQLPHMFHPLSGGTWMVGGGLPIAVLARHLTLPLADEHGSLSAWLAQRLGRPPKPGDMHREAGAEFTVRRVRRGKVFEVSVTGTSPNSD